MCSSLADLTNSQLVKPSFNFAGFFSLTTREKKFGVNKKRKNKVNCEKTVVRRKSAVD